MKHESHIAIKPAPPGATGSPINIALIETRGNIGATFESVARDCGISARSFVAPFADASDLARRIEPSVDAILCRPGTAEHVACAVQVPVIAIPITSFDLVSAISGLKGRFRRGAVFCYGRTFAGIGVIERIFGCTLFQYAYTDTAEIAGYVEDAARRGAEYCLGGSLTQTSARRLGLKGVEILPNEDSIYRSIGEALHTVAAYRQERDAAARLKMAVDSISEGIVVTDTDGKVVIYNRTAEAICRTEETEVIGKNIADAVRDPGIAMQFRPGEQETGFLKTIQGRTFAFHKNQVLVDSSRIGAVYTFEDVTKIQHMEALIRHQLRVKGLVPKYRFDDIIALGKPMQDCKDLARRYAATGASILIEGESGTGKELFAQSIHNASPRADGPFVAVNCAAIPETLLESELFGYEGGAFTGARKEGKPGLFEQAHQGTIFLDEIGEIPAPLQARLLRVLQEREVRRVGGDRVIAIDIRIVSATNRNLLDRVHAGTFRGDLLYRLDVLHLKIPSLRERKEDIPPIAADILGQFGQRPSPAILQAIRPILLGYDWPGNVRELRNILERLSLLVVDAHSADDWVGMLRQVLQVPGQPGRKLRLTVELTQGLKDIVHQVERQVLDQMLLEHDNDYAAVASRLGIGRTSMWRKARR